MTELEALALDGKAGCHETTSSNPRVTESCIISYSLTGNEGSDVVDAVEAALGGCARAMGCADAESM